MIGAGFGRTGTASLKAALEDLGSGPCYHMTELFEHPDHAQLWQAAWRGEPTDWDELLNGYESGVDWPECSFYEQLMERYPDAKVLLSVRDPERWYESVRSTIYELTRLTTGTRRARLTFSLLAPVAPGALGSLAMVNEIIWNGTFEGRFEDKDHAIQVFERHNEEVRRRVPPERLLVYEVKEGWEPLCEFLGVEVPERPFPHLNDAAEMRRRILGLRAASIAIPTVVVLLAAGILALLGRRARQQ